VTASRAAELSAAVGAKARADRVAALRDGRRERAAKFTPEEVDAGPTSAAPSTNRRSYR
jgi:hypothetical protein